MNVKNLLRSLPYLKKAGLVPNLIGLHGIGKSSIVEQFSKIAEMNFFPFFLSQMNDMGDLLGLPEFNRDLTGKAISTSFVHPKKLPKTENSLLFFDELNHATKEISQGIFQLILEGELHDYKLPDNSMIVTAMNPATDDYGLSDHFQNKAFGDRFVHIHFEPTHEEFHEYLSTSYGRTSVSDFLRQEPRFLEDQGLQQVSLDFVKPSRRSWDRLHVLESTGIPEDLFKEVGMGIVGPMAMVTYLTWRESQDKIVHGVDILENYAKVRDSFLSYFRDLKTGEELKIARTDKVGATCSSLQELTSKLLSSGEFSRQNAENLKAFLLDAPLENMYAILVSFRDLPGFVSNKHTLEVLHEDIELIAKARKAKIASLKYAKLNGNKLTQEEQKIIEDS